MNVPLSLILLLVVAAICLAVPIRYLFEYWLLIEHQQGQLYSIRRKGLRATYVRLLQSHPRMYQWLTELCEAAQVRMSPSTFIGCTVGCLILGAGGGALLVQSTQGVLLCSSTFATLPLVYVYTRLTQQRLQAQNDFLPAIELYYQCCLLSEGRQIRTALQQVIDEKRLRGPLQSIFEQLLRNLTVRGDEEASLRIFAQALGHMWGEYFVNIVRAGLQEGYPIAPTLKRLIDDMRKARLTNQQERNKLLEIRIANFTPILFLALFVGINLHYNRAGSIQYYFYDLHGRELILHSLTMIFGSFLIGLWLSRKKL